MGRDAGRLILVVEDDADLAATCERLLRRRGHAVVAVGSRAAALRALHSGPPALLVSDVRLPDGDGLDVVRAATAMQPRVPAVVMTGRASEPGRLAAKAAGALEYLSKPFTAEGFAGLVDRMLLSAGA
jgi:DNA-binding NtrC family response regulator